MNVPIRMLGIATVILWVFLAAYIAVAANSFKDLNFGAGEPVFSASTNGELLFAMPLYIDNRGVCSLKDLNIITVFSDAEGAEISIASTTVPLVLHGQNTTVFHNVSLNMKDLLNKEEYLFDDGDLAASITAGLTFAELLPVEISKNFTYPWGAPFYGFTLEQASFRLINATHGSINVPVSFENHAAFNITGNMRIELCGSDDSVLGVAQAVFDVPQQSVYAGDLKFIVPLDSASPTALRGGYFNVYFSTSLFEYGPLVIPYG
ncbi:hypothetical protein G4O51_11595 [Candidatus Bathyarchaeota archaeon A05DMB-2]|jgi:hypothetical protein|nr:hypothetical protein [Candidatus Bathyarchaeota archaeon A05DMB-2]